MVCRFVGLRVCVFERKYKNVNADLFKHTQNIMQKHVKNHEQSIPNWPKILQKSIKSDPWVVLGRFRCHFAPRSAPGRLGSFN